MTNAIEVQAAIGSLKLAMDMAATIFSMKVGAERDAKAAELTGLLAKAHRDVLASYERQLALHKEMACLEEKVVRLESWADEKVRYQLKPVGPGNVAYVLKPEYEGAEAPHYLCAQCYAGGEKGFLQFNGKYDRGAVHECSRCGAKVVAPQLG